MDIGKEKKRIKSDPISPPVPNREPVESPKEPIEAPLAPERSPAEKPVKV